MHNTINIFLAEDDQAFGSVLKSYLELNKFSVTWCKTGSEAFREFNKRNDWSICLLDVMMPDIDGFTLAQEIRKSNPDIPLLFLTAKSLKEDILKGYQSGADDYIIKPFDADVLFYKINALLTRSNKEVKNNTQTQFTLGTYTFNHATRVLACRKEQFQLSPKEADLLQFLCNHLNDIMPRDLALKSIWGNNDYFTGRSMDVYIAKLRKYLKHDPALEIINVHGKGFRLSDQSLKI